MLFEFILFILGMVFSACIFLSKAYFSEFSKKHGEIDAQKNRLEDISAITKGLESIKETLKKPTIEYQIRTAELYKKSHAELDLVYRSFLDILYSLKEVDLKYNLREEQSFSEQEFNDNRIKLVWDFRSLEHKIILAKKQLKESFIWLPKELAVFIDQRLIHIAKEFSKNTSTFKGNNDYTFMENEIKSFFTDFTNIISSCENSIMNEINKYEIYSITQLINHKE